MDIQELAKDPIDDSGTSDLEKYVEKPDLQMQR